MAALTASNVHNTEEIVIGTQDDDGTKVEQKPIGHTGTKAPILPGEVNNLDPPAYYTLHIILDLLFGQICQSAEYILELYVRIQI